MNASGVLVHVFDQLEDWGHSRGFAPCHSGWCADSFQFESCTIVNSLLPHLFGRGAGVVLSPATRVSCAFPADGGTQGKSLSQVCGRPACSRKRWWGCAFPAHQLADMMRAQLAHNPAGYNEVVVSVIEWDEHLPDVIEAIVSLGDLKKARAVHRAFLSEYPAMNGFTPLVQYSIAGEGFTEVR